MQCFNIEKVMKPFRRLLCAIFGHSFYSVALNNFHLDGSSWFGTYKCQRCPYTEDWQYDL